MNVPLRCPLRCLVIGILAGFFIVTGLLTYLATRPVVIQRVEQEASDRLRDQLNQLRGVLHPLLRSKNLEGARSVVASLGSAPEHELSLLTDVEGRILASTRLADIGTRWTSLDMSLDTRLIEQVGASGSVVVRLNPDTQRLTGYAYICGAVEADTLRPRQCGFLYQQINLKAAKATAVAALHRQTVGYGLGLAVVAGVLGLVFHSVVTQRVERLIATGNRFSAGETTARAGLQGQGKLARVSDAFDVMAQTIANHQKQLHDMNTQLAQRLREREQTEEALQRERDLAQSLIETAQVIIVIMDTEGRIVHINPFMEDLSGYRLDEVQGQDWFMTFLPRTDQEPIRSVFQKGIHTSQRRSHINPIMTKDGRERLIEWHNQTVIDTSGVTLARLAIGIDITERQRMEEALQKANTELERRVWERTAALEVANEEVRRFAYIVSHDLRAPLINLKGFAGELRDLCELLNAILPELLPHLEASQRTEVERAITQYGPEALDFIEASVTRMDDLIRSVLDLSRAGQRELYIEPVDMEVLAQHIAQTLTYQLTQSDARITIEPLPTVNADYLAMEQILDNLLGNAVKYLEPSRPGEITVQAERKADTTTFYVCDNGRGIAEGDLPRVFELFRRVGQQDTPGEGMGLSYVQTLVRRHGGEITCQSTLGVGTTFSFTIANHLVPTDPDAVT